MTTDATTPEQPETLASLRAQLEEAEKELRNHAESLDAKRKYVIACNHPPEQVIDSENGPICCECWAREEEKLRKTAEAALAAIKDRVLTDEDFDADEIVKLIEERIGRYSQSIEWFAPKALVEERDNLLARVAELEKDKERPALEPNKRYTRFEDMSPNGTLTLILQEDGDVIVTLYGRGITGRENDMRMASVEFCFPGGGGGQSSRTRLALQMVAEAIIKDNEERPQHRESPTS